MAAWFQAANITIRIRRGASTYEIAESATDEWRAHHASRFLLLLGESPSRIEIALKLVETRGSIVSKPLMQIEIPVAI